ncbi:hypothetical protein TWF506_003969 [Arthrobotrys conoides]|uniref:Oxidoreductase acuF-like C2H2 type zinc-finger domain-containing protein n=1 Tax=Arthrobotrys conoides TaxID=74498 RepID=A0AAN8RPQ7_9PEZI
MVENPHSIQSLNEVGLQTIELFSKIAWKSENDTLIDVSIETLLSAEADRFGLWAVSLGLFVPGHGSLDYRVRGAENIKDVIKGLLETLNESLNEVIEYVSPEDGDQGPESPQSDPAICLTGHDSDDEWWDEPSHDDAPDLEMVVDSIKDPIDRLYKLSTWIRNPSTRLASSKIISYKQIDEESGADLLEGFISFDYDYIESVFAEYRKSKAREEFDLRVVLDHEEEPRKPELSPNQRNNFVGASELYLVRRLAHANGRRRQQFSYWRRHREKLALHTTGTNGENFGLSEYKLILKDAYRHEGKSGQVRSIDPLSVTTATRLNIPHQVAINDTISVVSVSKYAASNWSPGNEILDFPAAPRCSPEQKFFECPYCFTLCPSATFEGEAWKAHLVRDLRPYVCTYEDCKSPNQLYDTRRDWLQHEGSMHRRTYHCPKHPDHDFLSISDYREHLNDGHLSPDGNIPMNLIIQSNESTLTVPDRPCPICLVWIDGFEALQKHIALHLERFAIFSLPRDIHDHDDNDVDSNRNREGSRNENLDGESPLSTSTRSIGTFADLRTGTLGQDGIGFSTQTHMYTHASEEPWIIESWTARNDIITETEPRNRDPVANKNRKEVNNPDDHKNTPHGIYSEQELVLEPQQSAGEAICGKSTPNLAPAALNSKHSSANSQGEVGMFDMDDEDDGHLAWDSKSEENQEDSGEISDFEGLIFTGEESENDQIQQSIKPSGALSRRNRKQSPNLPKRRVGLSSLSSEDGTDSETELTPRTSSRISKVYVKCLFPGCAFESSHNEKQMAVIHMERHQERIHLNWFRNEASKKYEISTKQINEASSTQKDQASSAIADAYKMLLRNQQRMQAKKAKTRVIKFSDLEDADRFKEPDDVVSYEPFIPKVTQIAKSTEVDWTKFNNLFLYAAGAASVDIILPIAEKAIFHENIKQIYFIWTAKQLTEPIRKRADKLGAVIPSLKKASLHETEKPLASSILLQRWTITETILNILHRGRPDLQDLLCGFMASVPRDETCGIVGYGRGSTELKYLVQQTTIRGNIDVVMYTDEPH